MVESDIDWLGRNYIYELNDIKELMQEKEQV